MSTITRIPPREIIEDFAREIKEKKIPTAKPSKAVINFRNERIDSIERPVCLVPIELLRYRKENGRISSDIEDYVLDIGPLDEKDNEAQKIIRDFLKEKDPMSTAILRKSIILSGQQEPAIITCDGFLINGNRRKMVIEGLREEDPGNEKYRYMKVVILPGKDDEGGPPDIKEIEQIENRYQLQKEGKSEYYKFDRALSIKRKIDIGMSLEEQLRDDPQFAYSTKSQIEKAIKDYEKEYLKPLECVDRYLRQFGREGHYRTISKGMSDPEGRWQAFLDYSKIYESYFNNPTKRQSLRIEEDEIGQIEEAAFDIIRLRVIKGLKVHNVMRKLHKYCEPEEGKKEIISISNEVEPRLPENECVDENGNSLDHIIIDRKWEAKNRHSIISHLKKAHYTYETIKVEETPIALLEAALKKLTHKNMIIQAINPSDLKTARDWASKIQIKAQDIESEIYHQLKEQKKAIN